MYITAKNLYFLKKELYFNNGTARPGKLTQKLENHCSAVFSRSYCIETA
jgi:hypothetical protein